MKKKLSNLFKKNCLQLGTILKVHGIKGEVVVKLSLRDYNFEEELVFVNIDNYLVPFFIFNDLIRDHSENSVILKFENFDTPKEVQKLLNQDLYIPNDWYNQAEVNEDYELKEYINYILFDKNNTRIGQITDFIDISGNPLFEVDYRGKKKLIPINSLEIIEENKENKYLLAILPDGILKL